MPWLAPNSFQLPRTANVDFRLQKGFTIHESWKLLLSGDAFNLFNHNNVTGVDTQMYTICGSNARVPRLRHANRPNAGVQSALRRADGVEQHADRTAADSGWHPTGFLSAERHKT